jgi:hypothetical protein
VISAVQWSAGTYRPGTFLGVHAVGAFLAPYVVAVIYYLDRSAAATMRTFRPALRGDEALFQRLTYILTTLPSRLALAAGLGVLLAGVIVATGAAYMQPSAAAAAALLPRLTTGFAVLFTVGPTAAAYVVTIVVFVLNWFVGGTLVLHTIRRLVLVPRIYRHHTEVDLFRQAPLYALSRLTAQTTIAAVVVVYGIASVPTYVSQAPGWATVLAIALLALACFVLPLVRVHRILAGEKERRLEGIADRLNDAGGELHRRIQQGRYRGMDELNKALAGLEIERNMVAAIPTWPWQPETLRTLLLALLLPLIVWAIQYVLQRVIGA